MFQFFETLSPVWQAFFACMFTFLITSLGSSIVFMCRKINQTVLDGMLGLAAGIMIASSFFSLISPAIDMANVLNMPASLIVTISFVLGGLILFVGDNIYSYYLKKEKKEEDNKLKRTIMLIFSITMHNIPEGMAIGVAFGSLVYGLDGVTLLSALSLAIGIGIQNFPEGSAISLPMFRDGHSKIKAFTFGALSGIVEPISGVIGALLVLKIRVILPILLALAAGAMIYVVVEEIIPESQLNKNKDLMAITTIIGFAIMMFLDVVLG